MRLRRLTFTEQIQAATATPSAQATVKGQLDTLMQDFEGGATPAWAAGAMRNANAQMAARGLGCFVNGRSSYYTSSYGSQLYL